MPVSNTPHALSSNDGSTLSTSDDNENSGHGHESQQPQSTKPPPNTHSARDTNGVGQTGQAADADPDPDQDADPDRGGSGNANANGDNNHGGHASGDGSFPDEHDHDDDVNDDSDDDHDNDGDNDADGNQDAASRVRSDSSLFTHIKTLHDDDIGLFVDIVFEADRLMPTLPARDQQPTTALFQALEAVLQRNDEEVDQDQERKFTPLIFKVGAEPGNLLMDRAHTVFDRLNVELRWLPDDYTQNIEYYKNLEASGLQAHSPPPQSLLGPSSDSRHVRWRDEASGRSKLHDSYTYDRPSSYTGSPARGTGSRDDLGSPAAGSESEAFPAEQENSDSFDSYYSEDDRGEQHPLPRQHLQTPHRPPPQLPPPPGPEDESSSVISSPISPSALRKVGPGPQSHDSRREQDRTETEPSSSSQRPGVSGSGANPRSDNPTLPPKPMPAPLQTPGDAQVPPTLPLPNTSPQRIRAPGPSLPHNKAPQQPEQPSSPSPPPSSPDVPHDGTARQGPTDNTTTNLTASVPAINQFRAHAQRFQQQALLRRWRDATVVTRNNDLAKELKAHQFRTVRLADKILYYWRSQTQRRTILNIQMTESARQFDEHQLSSTALDLWRDRAACRRQTRLEKDSQEQETERFFENLEVRAERAYNFYIMAKALTHWAVRAREEKERTETARRHIMRIRYFDSWKQYTAVNELKVRQFATRKAFTKLRQRFAQLAQTNQQAIYHFQRGLVESVLEKWLRTTNQRFGLFVVGLTTKRKVLETWMWHTRQRREQRVASQSQAGQTALRNFMSAWQNFARARLVREQQADRFHAANVGRRVFDALKKKADLQRRYRELAAQRTGNLLRDVLGIWANKSAMEQMAAAVDHVKILREALYKWALKQRGLQSERERNQRLVAASMKQWHLAETEQVLTRMNQRRLMLRVLDGMRYLTAATKCQDAHNDRIAINFNNRQLKTQAFRSWYTRLDRFTRMEHQAEQFYEYHLKMRVWTILADRVNYLAELSAMAGRLWKWNTGTKVLRIWKAGTEETRKRRVASAYSTCRQRVKLRTATRILSRLNAMAFQRRQQEFVADQLATHEVRKKALLAWRDRTRAVQAIESRGYNILQVGVLGKWRQLLTDHEVNELRAQEYYRTRLLHDCVRAWALKGLQMRAHEFTAMKVQEKADRKSLRKVLNVWYHETAQRVQVRGAQPHVSLPQTPRPPPPPGPGPGPGNAPRTAPGGFGGYGSSTYGSVLGTPAPQTAGPASRANRLLSAYRATPTPTTTSGYITSRHLRSRSQNLSTTNEEGTNGEGDNHEDDTVRIQTPQPTTTLVNATQSGGGGSYFSHRRGGSAHERRPSRLSNHYSLGPYPPLDEEEEEEAQQEEESPTSDAEGDDYQQGEIPPPPPPAAPLVLSVEPSTSTQGRGSRASSRAQSTRGTSTPTPVRFNERLSSTTPFEPLSTPFEKQLREQYGASSGGDAPDPIPASTSPSTSGIPTITTRSLAAPLQPSAPRSNRYLSHSKSTHQVPVATGLVPPPTRIISGGTSDADTEGGGPVQNFIATRSSLPVPGGKTRTTGFGATTTGVTSKGGLGTGPAAGPAAGTAGLVGRRSIGRVRFSGDVRSASDSSTGAVVEGSKGGRK